MITKFNQDNSFFVQFHLGEFKYIHSHPYKDFIDEPIKLDFNISLIEMLYKTNLFLIVPSDKKSSLFIYDDNKGEIVFFPRLFLKKLFSRNN